MKFCKVHTNVKAPGLCPICMYEELERHKRVTRALIAVRELRHIGAENGEAWWGPEETPPECIAWSKALDEAEAELEAALIDVT